MRAGVHAPTYRSWQMMKNRCLNPAATDYAYYGGRGISIAAAWHDYDAFVADMGERPASLTLERKDGNGWYSKDNCHWASRLAQARNREYTLNLTFQGQTLKVWEWAEKLALKPTSLHIRLSRYRLGQITEAQVFKQNPRAK